MDSRLLGLWPQLLGTGKTTRLLPATHLRSNRVETLRAWINEMCIFCLNLLSFLVGVEQTVVVGKSCVVTRFIALFGYSKLQLMTASYS